MQKRFIPTELDALWDAQILYRTSAIDGRMQDLFPEEQLLVAHAVPKRQREFATGRLCARRLLARIGFDQPPLMSSSNGSPLWPTNVVGSISHTSSICVVVVAPRTQLIGVGIDVEPDEPIESMLWPSICTPGELQWLALYPQIVKGRLVRLIFSAKESFYKCQFPLLKRRLDFHDIEARPDLATGRLNLRVLDDPHEPPLNQATITGRWLSRNGWIFCGTMFRKRG